ncbi:MAG TPA: PIN domain-containing protein [Candidatus Lokiarchaeia archaeon]|nr:PIN domain-containing protein [Candidatus Lokiarchaeia archaeon]
MPVADTEVLFALNPEDVKHDFAMDLLQGEIAIVVPDVAMLEFQTVLRGRGTSPTDTKKALIAVHEVLKRLNIAEVSTLNSDLLALQCDIEENYNLSYFDSLIATSALVWDNQIVSDDEEFDRVPTLQRIPLKQIPVKND